MQIPLSKITGITIRCNNCGTQMDFTLALLERQQLHEIHCPGCNDRLSISTVSQIAKAYNRSPDDVQSIEVYGVVEYFTDD